MNSYLGRTRAPLLAILAATAAWPQTGGPKFDAVSVKLASLPGIGGAMSKQPGGRGRDVQTGGPGTSDPGRIHYPAVTLEFLLLRAYDVNNFQLAAPSWITGERFDIDATMPASTTPDQFRAMLQNLLAERFQLAIHRESRESSGYGLVVAKGGPKMKESAGTGAAADDAASDGPGRPGPDGYFIPPKRPGVFFQLVGMQGARAVYQQVTMRELAASLQSQLKHPVADSTGLTGKYDFALNYAREGLDLGTGRIPMSGMDGDPLPELPAALSSIGLKLEAKKMPVDTVVVDHLEKTPTEN